MRQDFTKQTTFQSKAPPGVFMKSTVNGKGEETEFEKSLNWMYELKDLIERAPYGKNRRTVAESLEEQNERHKQVVDYKQSLDKVLRKSSSQEEKERLQNAYDSLLDISQKKINCLKTMLDITTLEELCGSLSNEFDNRAVHLVNTGGQKIAANRDDREQGFVAPSSQDCIFAAKDNWDWILKLANCIEVHLKNAAEYHQYFHEIDESAGWMVEDITKLQKCLEVTPLKGNYDDANKLLNEIKEIGTCLRQWESKVNFLWDQGNRVVPVYLRTQGVKEPTPMRSLCNYTTGDMSVREGEDLLLLDNSQVHMWKVRNNRGQEAYIPALACLIPGPTKEAIDQAVKMRLQLLAAWTNTLKQIGQRLICFMLLVFKPDYSDGEIKTMRSIRMLEKQDLNRILDYIEETLQVHWEDHEGFQNLQERLLSLRMILDETSEAPLEDDQTYRALVVQITTLEEMMKKYKDLWKNWEKYKVALEASRQPELMLIVDKWEQLQFVSRDYFAKFWKNELSFDEFEKTLAGLKKLAVEGAEGLENGDMEVIEEKITNISEMGEYAQRRRSQRGSSKGDHADGLDEYGEDGVTIKRVGVLETSTERSPGMRRVHEASVSEEGIEEVFEEGLHETRVGYQTTEASQSVTDEDGGFGYATERKTAETEQLSQAESEESKTFIIKAVIDPRNDAEISLQDAIMAGIINPNQGIYHNLLSGDSVPIPVAMTAGLIKVMFTSTRRTQETKSSVGVITVKTVKEKVRPYTITGVTNTQTGEKLTVKEAARAGILDEPHGIFIDKKQRKELLVADAVDAGLVDVEYQGDSPEAEVVSKTYAVRGVVDRAINKIIPFGDAVRRGIIDKDSGGYLDTKTGETMYVGDAIMRGFLKARPIDDPTSVNIDPTNKMVIDKTEKIKEKVLRPLKVISALRRAAQKRGESSE